MDATLEGQISGQLQIALAEGLAEQLRPVIQELIAEALGNLFQSPMTLDITGQIQLTQAAEPPA